MVQDKNNWVESITLTQVEETFTWCWKAATSEEEVVFSLLFAVLLVSEAPIVIILW